MGVDSQHVLTVVGMVESSVQGLLSGVMSGNAVALAAFTPVLLLSLRVAVVLGLTPVFYAMPIPGRVRAVMVVALSVVLAAGLQRETPTLVLSAGRLIEAALVEVALGATLALGVLLAFAAFSMAGNLLDIQIGFGLAQVFDPVSNRPSLLLVSAFNYAAVLVFFLIDGHHALLRAIAYSTEAFPLGAPWRAEWAAGSVLKQVGGLFSLGFALAAPVVFCILLVELALGVISRNLPQVNMLVIGIPTKIVVGLAVLSLWFAGMGPVMNRVYSGIYEAWTSIFLSGSNVAPSFDGSSLHRGLKVVP
jgi:flagellar biosynthetic protein FliR